MLLAVTTAFVVTQTTAEARRLRADYGATRPVLVVVQDVAAGTGLQAVTDLRSWPEGLVPPSAVTELPAGATSAFPLPEGTVVTAAAIRDDRVDPERGAVAVARTPTTPPATIGTRVVLVVAADPFGGIDATLVDGVVSEVTDTQLVVSVDRSDLVVAGSAIAAGTVIVAVSG